MSFEDDMIDAGFNDEGDYLDYICDLAQRRQEELSSWENDNLMYDDYNGLGFDDVEEKEVWNEFESVKNRYKQWLNSNPIEVNEWEGDYTYFWHKDVKATDCIMLYENHLKEWIEWKNKMSKRDTLIEHLGDIRPAIDNLIKQRVIKKAFLLFLYSTEISSIVEYVNLIAKDYSEILNNENNTKNENETNSIYLENLLIKQWDYFMYCWNNHYSLSPASHHIIKKLSIKNHHTYEFDNSFHWEVEPTPCGIYYSPEFDCLFQSKNGKFVNSRNYIELEKKNLSNNCVESYKVKMLEKWFLDYHYQEWNAWATTHINKWKTFIRNGFSKLYEDVWWGKHSYRSIKYSEWRKTEIGQNSGNALYRRLIDEEMRKLSISIYDIKYMRTIFNEGVAPYRESEYCNGFVNLQGEVVIKPHYSDVDRFYNGFSIVKTDAIPEKIYSEDEDNGVRCGLINHEDKFVIEPKYDVLSYVRSDNVYIFAVDCEYHILCDKNNDYYEYAEAEPGVGKWGLINSQGVVLLEEKYNKIASVAAGLFKVNIGEKFVKDISNEYYIPNMPEIEDYGYLGGKWGLMDIKGNLLTPIKYSSISDFIDDIAIVTIDTDYRYYLLYFFTSSDDNKPYRGGLWGAINRNGEEVIPLKYYAIGELELFDALIQKHLGSEYSNYFD